MNHTKNVKQLEKMLIYILSKRPDEFGLVLDSEGFVRITDLVRALSEEDGFRGVREASVREVLFSLGQNELEAKGDMIRSRDRSGLSKFENTIPKLLFIAVKKKAYAHIVENGILPNHGQTHVLMSSDYDLAMRIGKRRDNEPVMITVPTSKAANQGVDLNRAGENLYTSRFIPADLISGPPVEKVIGPPKEKSDKAKDKKTADRFSPGSFFMRLGEDSAPKREPSEWKKSGKRLRREKRQIWPDE